MARCVICGQESFEVLKFFNKNKNKIGICEICLKICLKNHGNPDDSISSLEDLCEKILTNKAR
jgi:hypothetical protein